MLSLLLLFLLQHELLGFPIEKVSFPDYTTKRTLLPFFFAEYLSTPPPAILQFSLI